MGCCLTKSLQDTEKDEPLLLEHLNSKDNTVDAPAAVVTVTTDAKHETREEPTEKISVLRTNPTDDPEAVEAMKTDSEPSERVDSVASMPKPKPKSKAKAKHRKRDSVIDVASLQKFDASLAKREKEKKSAVVEKAVFVQLRVKSMDPRFPEMKVEVAHTLSVFDLKSKIAEMAPDKIGPFQQRLIHRGRLLKDHRSLKQYGISDGPKQTLMLVRSSRKQTTAAGATNGQSERTQRKNLRSRAMTLGAHHPMVRSATPDPSQLQMTDV